MRIFWFPLTPASQEPFFIVMDLSFIRGLKAIEKVRSANSLALTELDHIREVKVYLIEGLTVVPRSIPITVPKLSCVSAFESAPQIAAKSIQ